MLAIRRHRTSTPMLAPCAPPMVSEKVDNTGWLSSFIDGDSLQGTLADFVVIRSDRLSDITISLFTFILLHYHNYSEKIFIILY